MLYWCSRGRLLHVDLTCEFNNLICLFYSWPNTCYLDIYTDLFTRVEELRDSTAHAEMICIREASNVLRSWRLAVISLLLSVLSPSCHYKSY